jgi:hypothetical protein
MKWVTVILITILVSACGGAKQVQSNVTVTEYVVRDRVVHDTVPVMRDTTIYRDSVRIEIRYIKGVAGGETNMALKAECPPSKVRVITQTVTIEKVRKQRTPFWSGALWALVVVISVVSIAALWINRLTK